MKQCMKRAARLAAVGAAAALAAALLWPGSLSTAVAVTLLTVCYHLWMRLLVGGVFDRRMNNRCDLGNPWFAPRRWEPALWRALRVKRWKVGVPSWEPELFDTKERSLEEVAMAMCQAELVHETCAVLSFLPLAAVPWLGAAPVFLLTSLAAALLDLMFVFLQRYNRPRLLRLMQRRKKQ